MSVKERLIEFINTLQIGQSQFEKNCDISNGSVNNIRTSIGPKNLSKIKSTYPKLNEIWLLHGVGEMLTNSDLNENVLNEPTAPYHVKRNDLKNGKEKKHIPFYDADASAGNLNSEIMPIQAPAGTIYIGDLLNDSEAAIRIYGNSMIPNYPPGCVIGLVRCRSKFIEPGEVYVIETADRRMVKRIFYKNDESHSDFFTCYSDNTMLFDEGARLGKLAYPPFDIPVNEIINIFIVTGVIKRNTNSIIINRN
jgi:hypothetical protein